MNTLKIHHIGYLVKKINAAVKEFEHLGFTLIQDITYDNYRKVNICFLEKDGYTISSPICPFASPTIKHFKLFNVLFESTKANNDKSKIRSVSLKLLDYVSVPCQSSLPPSFPRINPCRLHTL